MKLILSCSQLSEVRIQPRPRKRSLVLTLQVLTSTIIFTTIYHYLLGFDIGLGTESALNHLQLCLFNMATESQLKVRLSKLECYGFKSQTGQDFSLEISV